MEDAAEFPALATELKNYTPGVNLTTFKTLFGTFKYITFKF
jgi:hypothetical protein